MDSQRLLDVTPRIRTGDAFLFATDPTIWHPESLFVIPTLRWVGQTHYMHISKVLVSRLVPRVSSEPGGPTEVWINHDTPEILTAPRLFETHVRVFHASRHTGVQTQFAKRVIERHRGSVVWVPLNHERAHQLNPNYQSILEAQSIIQDGLDYSVTNLARHARFFRAVFRANREAWECSRLFAVLDYLCGFPVRPHAIPPELVESSMYRLDLAERLEPDFVGPFHLYDTPSGKRSPRRGARHGRSPKET